MRSQHHVPRYAGLALFLGLSVLTSVASADESAAEPVTPTAPLPSLPPAEAAPPAAQAPAPPAETTAPAQPFGACQDTPSGCAAETRAARGGWYGYQTLSTDSAALLLLLASAKLGAGAGLASLGTYTLGGPIVHLVHGKPAMFAASLGTRLLSPVLGTVTGVGLGAALDGCRGGGDFVCGGPIVGAAIGALTGFAAAVTLDAAVFSREHASQARPEQGAWDGKPTLAPTVSASPSGGALGVGGVF